MQIMDKFYKLRKKMADKKGFDYLNSNKLFGYNKNIETNKYIIYKKPYKGVSVVAAHDDCVVYQVNNDLLIYPICSNKSYKFKVKFNEKTFPGLLQNSKIDSCILLPYMREVRNSTYTKLLRLVVITNKGQIFHNYPARSKNIEGPYYESDLTKFEESVIWDLPYAKYPSKNKIHEVTERYYPGLPEQCYQYHPLNNDDLNYKDKYNNGGFGKYFNFTENGQEINLPRFYQYSRHEQANSFHFIGCNPSDTKMNIIATYRSNTNVGARMCVFATDDGGRMWFCKYEFADYGSYEFIQGDSTKWGHNYGNLIKNFDYHQNYLSDSISIMKRNLVIDSNSDIMFEWDKNIYVSEILDEEYLTFKTKNVHNLKTGNIICAQSNDKKLSCKWIINNNVDNISLGNNLLFKVEVIDEYTIRIRECITQSNHNVCCRHIHHVNRIKDGWVVGTGEIYPNGWLLYFQMKEADTFSIKRAYESFGIYKLNDSENSVQRTLGAFFTDDEKPKLIFASDHDLLSFDKNVEISKLVKSDFSRSSTGVYIGNLSDINNRNKFNCIYEAIEPCFFFQKINNVIVFCGQRGELALSFDDGKTWDSVRIHNCFMKHYGDIGKISVFDNYIIVFK